MGTSRTWSTVVSEYLVNRTDLNKGHTARVEETVRHATLPVRMEQHSEFEKLAKLRQEMRDLSYRLRSARGREKGMGHARKSKIHRQLESLEFRITNEVLSSVDVICSTLVGVGCDALKPFTFSLILIDEASQAVEPACMISLAHSQGNSQIIMIGDHKQLPPVVLSENKQMQMTLFDRFMDITEKAPSSRLSSSLLRIQYRMHPLISHWPNQQFYGGRLLDGVKSEERLPPEVLAWPNAGPVLFCPCYGKEETKPHNKSKFNKTEAQRVSQIVQTLLTGLPPEHVGVITPYQAQTVILSDMLPKGVEVNTVDGFQGREKEVIIFSAVRSNPSGEVGFLKDYRRVNVAITRAKRGLIVFGNPNTLRHDPVWLSWLRFVKEAGLVNAGENFELNLARDEGVNNLQKSLAQSAV